MIPVTLKERFAEFPESFRNFRKDLSLRNIERIYLLRSQWDSDSTVNIVSGPYLCYRIFFVAYFIAGLVLSLTYNDFPSYWILFATNWSFIYQLVYSLASLANTLCFWYQERFSADHPYYHLKLNKFESFTWFMLTVSYSESMYISLAYWILVYGKSGDTTGITSIFGSLVVHGFNAVLAVVDVMIVATPLRVSHGLYSVLTALIYQLFSLFYELAGGTYRDPARPYIYGVLNWRETPINAVITCVGTCVAIIILHLIFWTLSVVRQHLATSHLKFSYDDDEFAEIPARKDKESQPLL